MQQAKDQAYPQKYLKASIVASYRSQTAAPATRWVTGWILPPFRTASLDIVQKVQYLFSEHILANLAIFVALVGLLTTARRRTSTRATVVQPLRFAFHWVSAFLALIIFSTSDGFDRRCHQTRFSRTGLLQAGARWRKSAARRSA